MFRTLGSFLLVFALLSLIVHLEGIGRLFGAGALSFLVIDLLVAKFARSPRPPRMRGESLL
jgi:hypothetical protein